MPKQPETKKRSRQTDQRQADPSDQPAGLDDERHRKGQESARQAELLRVGIFPALMASALGLDKFVDTPAFKVFLERLQEDTARTTNPIARMMIEQLALAHFRIAQLQVQAANAEGLEAAKIYNQMASRLLGEFRRSALALDLISSRSSEPKSKAKLRVLKMAQ